MMPGRHVMIHGDTKETLPVHVKNLGKVDFAFVDGGHDKATAISDIQLLAHAGTVMVDDINAPDVRWAWDRALHDKLLANPNIFVDSKGATERVWGVAAGNR